MKLPGLPLSYEKHCVPPITASYIGDQDTITVTNSCLRDDGEQDVADGVATFSQEPTTAKLKVTFLPSWLRWLGIGKGDYWVLYTDYTQIALVGSPEHKYLWILSRNEHPESALVTQMVGYARKEHYQTESLIFNYPDYLP